MSGFGGFGGFGQQNQQPQQQSGGFGGFGSTSTPSTGFGSTGTTGFGSTSTTGGGLFGGGGTSGGFGSSSGGFGNTGGAFGAKPGGAFGTATTTSGSSLFGNNTATAGSTGFGGFGATPAASSGFGSTSTTGGGLFGSAPKTGFGTSGTTASPFGGGSTSSPFGGTTTSAFGAPASSALGGGAGECQGTGATPFQPYVEKEPNSTTNQQNSFQSISFQAPYQKFSPEELRLADYSQGRRYGNSNGQAGAFGATNFGGFNQTSTAGGFGASTTTSGGLFGGGSTSTPFGGSSQPAQSGFGATSTPTTGGSLFGQKPAGTTGGLFGSTASQPSGGLFGSTGNTGFGTSSTTGGFGQTNTASGTGNSLFGNNNNANKGFSFGTSQPAATSGFGGTAPATTGFGASTGGGLFGNTNQPSTGFGTQQPAATNNPFGGFGGSTQQTGTNSLFGNTNNNAPKPGLFGSAQPNAGTGGGLFGSTNTTTNNNAFGANNNNQTGGGLFGAAKPNTPSGGLFGNTSTNNPSTGGGLFGGSFGANQNQNQGQGQNTGGLFGGVNNNNNNQPKPSLFGGSTGGSSLFGGTGNQQQSGGLFGNSNNNNQQQQNQSSLFGSNSMFNTSQQGQQTPQTLTTSIGDSTAFGSSLFAGLASTPVNNPGPVATPLMYSATKQKKAPPIPIARLNSTSTSRFSTPQKRTGGYGFTYSGMNTPSSVSSISSTPGTFSGSTLTSFGGFGKSLSKSVSTSNLRNSFSASDNILAPGAFSASPNARHFGSTGSVKKLNIHRNLRNDLFSPPPSSQQLLTSGASTSKKRVSFGDVHANGNPSPLKNAITNGSPSAEDLGLLRPPPTANGAKTSAPTQSEMEQVKGKELAVVREENTETPAPPSPEPELKEGDWYMKPSRKEIENMSHAQRQRVANFTVGRVGVGNVQFNPPVDLNGVNLDTVFGGIIKVEPRNLTVYADPATKPIQGKHLNVPATITMYNSYCRSKGRIEKNPVKVKAFREKLASIEDTTLISFNPDTGLWVFSVPHFTTYGYDEDEEEVSEFGQSTLSLPPDTPTPDNRTPRMDESFASTFQASSEESELDDTFAGIKRAKQVLPGAFDDQELFDGMEEVNDSYEANQESFLDNGSVGSQSENGVEEPMDEDEVSQNNESVSIVDQEMAGSYPEADNTAELDEDSQEDGEGMGMGIEATPGSIMRARMRFAMHAGTPSKRFAADNDWTNALLNTVSPKKQDRALLKSLINVDTDSQDDSEHVPVARRVVSDGRATINNNIDLMKSLFGQSRSPTKVATVSSKRKGLPWPYTKRSKLDESDSAMTESERKFHRSMKPNWGPDGTLVYAAPSNSKSFGRSSRRSRERDGILSVQKLTIFSEGRDVRFAKFSNESASELLQKQKSLTAIIERAGVPFASLPEDFAFSEYVDSRPSRDPATTHEKLVWQLASILFDEINVPEDLRDVPNVGQRLRKEKLSEFWEKLVEDASSKHVALARSHEEKAIASLSGHKVADACEHLLAGNDYHLATLVSLIGAKDSMKKDMREQLSDWQKSKILSEFSQPIRAIYEVLAGNVCVCDGIKGAPEDRVDSFIISKRFGLDWRQAFGLRLWYHTSTNDTVKRAVESFASDLAQEKEVARPQSWYIEQKVPKLWEDDEIQEREDLLWGLLKLFSFRDADLESVLRPENSQLSPLDIRLTWQLGQALIASGTATFGQHGEEKADQVTLSFASQLINEGSWLDAVFVLLHLTSDVARSKSIQNHLARHAALIGTQDSASFKTLVNTYNLPESWLWEAKALYCRSVERDPKQEVFCLVKGAFFDEAHRTFTRDVAPLCIVEMDYGSLRSLLEGFEGEENNITEWRLGGEIYQDFLTLLDYEHRGLDVPSSVIERLLAGLPAVIAGSRNASFMETVAVETMSGAVAKSVVSMGKRGQRSDMNKVLRLPLTEDKFLQHTVELSLEYYRGVMAGGR